MASPVFLIAEREFRTYVATWSFWFALAIAPLAATAALFFLGGTSAPIHVRIDAGGDPSLSQSAVRSIDEVAGLENKVIVVAQDGACAIFFRTDAQTIAARFDPGFPLSPVGRALALRLMAGGPPLRVRDESAVPPVRLDREALARLCAMAMLWMTLTGSLGMLLQAVVRERANRALESLLAAASSRQIVLGKIFGVGAVSLLVLSVWFGSAAVLAIFAVKGPVMATASLSNPLYLLRESAIYISAFAFYGSVTVALAALARDSAAAQNLARPMFALLLIGFLIALSSVRGSSTLGSWLIYVPFFAPFLLLALPSVAASVQVALLISLLVLSFVMVTLAAAFLNGNLKPRDLVRVFRNPTNSGSTASPL